MLVQILIILCVDKRLKFAVEEPRLDMQMAPKPHRLVEVRAKGRAHTFIGRYRVTPKNVATKWFIGPRREPLVEQWGEVQREIQSAEQELGEGVCGEGSVEAAKVLVKELEKWTEVAENELASSSDTFDKRRKPVGRNCAKFVWKPVMGWRSGETYQASTKQWAAWR